MVVDDTFDVATAAAVLAWWQSVDPAIVADPADLVVPAGSFVVVPAGCRSATPRSPTARRSPLTPSCSRSPRRPAW